MNKCQNILDRSLKSCLGPTMVQIPKAPNKSETGDSGSCMDLAFIAPNEYFSPHLLIILTTKCGALLDGTVLAKLLRVAVNPIGEEICTGTS